MQQSQNQNQNQSATGSYRLHAQGCLHSCRSKPHATVHVTPTSIVSRPQEEPKQAPNDRPKGEPAGVGVPARSDAVAVIPKMSTMAAPLKPNAATANALLSDDVIGIGIGISIDSMAAAGGPLGNGSRDETQLLQSQSQQPMVLSKKALHQRDADENLFLRFLELDPPADGNANSTTAAGNSTGGAAAGASVSNANANASNANHLNGSGGGGGGGAGSATRRCSTLPGSRQPTGRTPFTMTKRLTRTEERGFGFSIVWTHPPRVEKVESGLSADRCGILPGDYVIFVDKHNVVTMPEADVLNLIRSQGSSLTLEIFRRSGAGANMASNAANTISTAVTVSASHNHQPNSTAAQPQAQPQHQVQPQLQQRQHCGLGSLAPSEEQLATSGTVVQRTASVRPQLLSNTMSRPATACSGTTSSIEAAKRRLHLPQVTFSKEVGKGVIV